MISYSHLKFRQHLDRVGQKPLFKALWYPYGNYVVLAFVVLILGIMLMIPGIQVSVYAIPVWLAAMLLAYLAKGRRRPQANGTAGAVAK